MKVTYLITKATWGGAQQYVYDLMQEVLQKENKVELIFGEHGELAEKAKHLDVTIHQADIPWRISILRDIKAIIRLVAILEKTKPDTLHANSSKAGILGVIAGRLAGVPKIIFTAHGWAFNEKRPAYQKVIFFIVHYLTVLFSNKTIAVSENIKSSFVRLPFMASKISVIHNSIDCGDFLDKNTAIEKLSSEKREENTKYIGTIAELNTNKNIGVALEAIAKAVKEMPNIKYFVLGDGAEKQNLIQKIKELNLQNNVVFCGFVPGAKKYLKAFDLFLLTSRTEAFGYVLLEAGCAGVPVIAPRVGGIPEIIKNNVDGILIDNQNTQEIAESILKVLSDTELATKLSDSLKNKTLQKFNKKIMFGKTLALYQKS